MQSLTDGQLLKEAAEMSEALERAGVDPSVSLKNPWRHRWTTMELHLATLAIIPSLLVVLASAVILEPSSEYQ